MGILGGIWCFRAFSAGRRCGQDSMQLTATGAGSDNTVSVVQVCQLIVKLSTNCKFKKKTFELERYIDVIVLRMKFMYCYIIILLQNQRFTSVNNALD